MFHLKALLWVENEAVVFSRLWIRAAVHAVGEVA